MTKLTYDVVNPITNEIYKANVRTYPEAIAEKARHEKAEIRNIYTKFDPEYNKPKKLLKIKRKEAVE